MAATRRALLGAGLVATVAPASVKIATAKPPSDLEKRMASCHDGLAVIARARSLGLPDSACVGLANIQRGYQEEGRLQAIYLLPDGRHAFVMDDGVTYS